MSSLCCRRPPRLHPWTFPQVGRLVSICTNKLLLKSWYFKLLFFGPFVRGQSRGCAGAPIEISNLNKCCRLRMYTTLLYPLKLNVWIKKDLLVSRVGCGERPPDRWLGAQPAAPPPRLTHSTQAGRFRLQGQASLLRQAEHGPVLDFNFLFLT